MGFFAGKVRGDLAQRCDVVEDEEAASVGSGDEVVVLDLQIADGACGHVEAEGLPVIAVVEGDVDLGFASGVEEAFAFGVFADGRGGCSVGDAVVNLLPGLAAVMGAEEVRTHVVEAQGVDGGVVGELVEVARVHVEDLPEGLQLGRGDVGPVGPGIGGGPDEAVVGSCPDTVDVEGGEAERIDDAAAGNFCGGSVFEGLDGGGQVVGLAGEVGADLLPILATVAGEPEGVGSEVEIVGVGGGELKRFGADGAVAAERLRFDVADLARATIVDGDLSTVDEVGVEGVGGGVAVLLDAGGVPVVEGDASVVASAIDAGAAAILLAAADAVGEGVVGGDVVDLRGGLVVPLGPGFAGILGDDDPLVGGEGDDVGVVGIDEDVLVVVAAGCSAESGPGATAVGGLPGDDGGDVEGVGVFGVDARDRDVASADAGLGAGVVLRVRGPR